MCLYSSLVLVTNQPNVREFFRHRRMSYDQRQVVNSQRKRVMKKNKWDNKCPSEKKIICIKKTHTHKQTRPTEIERNKEGKKNKFFITSQLIERKSLVFPFTSTPLT